MARLFVVFVAYRSVGLPQVQRYLRMLQQRYQPQALVVVDNADQAPVGQLGDVPVIAGDNRLREFSGWDSGVAWLQRTAGLDEGDWILFANDTVCRQAHLRWLTLGRARQVIRRLVDGNATSGPSTAGPVVPCPMGEVRGFGTPFNEFVATFFFALPYRAYLRIGGLGVALPWHEWLGAAWPEPLFCMPDEAAYNRCCNQWLGCDQPSGVGGWPGSAARPFSAENYAFLRGKAQCILLEGRMAAELAALHPRLALNLYHPAPWNGILQWLFRQHERTKKSARQENVGPDASQMSP
jgi:hypothetical protein